MSPARLRPVAFQTFLPLLIGIASAMILSGTAMTQESSPPSQTPAFEVPSSQIDEAIERLDDLATGIMERSGIPGMAVAVVRDGQMVYAKGFGVRVAGGAAAVDAETVFQLASVSKSIGATVVAHQVSQGVVSWNTPVRDHLPWFELADPWVSKTVTIGDLYAHRSGLPDHAGDDLEDLGYPRREILERLRLLPLNAFRDSYAYTNFGLTAAAEAVAAASGADWATLSETALYRPLGMTSASSRYSDFEAHANRAIGHMPTPDGFRPVRQRQPDAQSPAGGVSANITDMAKWMIFVLNGGEWDGKPLIEPDALLPALSAQVITKPYSAASSRPSLYGFGIGVGVRPSGRVEISHSGAFALGAGTTYLMLPSLDLGIAVLTNASPQGVPEALSAGFADLVEYGRETRDWYPGYRHLMAFMTAPAGSLVGKEAPAAPSAAGPLDLYTGHYRNAYFGDATVTLKEGALGLKIGPDPQVHALQHWAGDSFVYRPFGENAMPGSLSKVDFARPETGPATALTIEFLDNDGLGTFSR